MNEETLFHEARQKQADERKAFLDEACGGDLALRRRIEILLEADESPDSLLELNPTPTSAISSFDEAPGHVIGPYKLLEQIGEGGMGVVFMAEQQEPVRRKVALKLIKPGMDTRQVIARFEAERQTLAVMDHPSIARVLDAGATESGRPYFVMELVRGVPITTYCDDSNLSVRERLELFASVCQAIQHAHTKGIIHRDIKPTNLLVTRQDGRPMVKVIDFGIAKAIGQQLTDKTLFTNFAQMIGTPLYMSPEQAEQSGVDIDTRSDIYSLGVLLYELLTGSTPVDKQEMKQAAFDEIRRIIREDEPQTPSARISGSRTLPAIAADRHIDPARLSRLVRGELDWIVMKALEKDRNRRYETADAFAADLLHYLHDEPVLACPPSATYRFGKFARRNRVALTTVALVAVALVLGTLVSTWQAIRAETARAAEAEQRKVAEYERKSADMQRAEAEKHRVLAEENFQMARKVVDEYFTLVSASTLLDGPGLQPLRKELLEAAQRFYEKTAVPKRLTEFELHARLLAVLNKIGDSDQILKVMGDNARLWPDLEPAHRGYGLALKDLGYLDEAIREFERGIEIDPNIPWLHNRIAEVRQQQNKLPEALDAARTAIRLHPTDMFLHTRLLEVLNAIGDADKTLEEMGDNARLWADLEPSHRAYGIALKDLGFLDEAIREFERGLEIDPSIPFLHDRIAEVRLRQNKLAEALDAARTAVRLHPTGINMHRRLLDVLNTIGDADKTLEQMGDNARLWADLEPSHRAYGIALQEQGLLDEAIREFERGLEIDPNMPFLYGRIAEVRMQQHKLPEALDAARSCALRAPKGGYAHGRLLEVLNMIGDPRQTLDVLRENARSLPGSEPAHHHYGLALKDQGLLDEALREFERGLEINPNTPWSYYHIAEIRLRQNKLPEALEAARSAVRMLPTESKFHGRLLEVLNATGDAQSLRESLAEITKLAAKFPLEPGFLEFMGHGFRYLGWMSVSAGRLDEARENFDEAVEVFQQLAANNEIPQRDGFYRDFEADTHRQLSYLLATGGKSEAAEQAARQAADMYEALANQYPDRPHYLKKVADARWRLGYLASAAGRQDEAELNYLDAINSYQKLIAGFPQYEDLLRVYDGLSRSLAATNRFEEADEARRKAVEHAPNDARALNNLAWSFATSADAGARNASLAVELAKQAVELDPKNGQYSNTLGVAYYRAGNWQEAIEWLNKSMEPRNGGSSFDWFFLAMAYWQLDNQDEARKWQAKAVEWMENNGSTNAELKRFRIEAEELLKDQSPEAEPEAEKKAERIPSP